MKINEDFKFRDDLIKGEKDTVPIELLTEPYKGVILRYTNVAVQEKDNNTATLKFDYELKQMGTGTHTETSLRKDTKFNTHIGLILNSLILEVVDNEHRETDTEESSEE